MTDDDSYDPMGGEEGLHERPRIPLPNLDRFPPDHKPWHERFGTKTIIDLLSAIGEDPSRDGLRDTPMRVLKSMGELFRGYTVKVEDLFTTFDEPHDEMVVLRDIEFFSTCEHHMLPFFGKAHIGYVPDRKIVGISKLARVLDAFSRRLQVQERLGQQIAQAIQEHLQPKGVGVILEAQHLCMVARGVQKQNSVMTTSAMLGAFRQDPAARAEFLAFARGSR